MSKWEKITNFREEQMDEKTVISVQWAASEASSTTNKIYGAGGGMTAVNWLQALSAAINQLG